MLLQPPHLPGQVAHDGEGGHVQRHPGDRGHEEDVQEQEDSVHEQEDNGQEQEEVSRSRRTVSIGHWSRGGRAT